MHPQIPSLFYLVLCLTFNVFLLHYLVFLLPRVNHFGLFHNFFSVSNWFCYFRCKLCLLLLIDITLTFVLFCETEENPATQNLQMLPRSLSESLEALQNDIVLRDLIGEPLMAVIIAVRKVCTLSKMLSHFIWIINSLMIRCLIPKLGYAEMKSIWSLNVIHISSEIQDIQSNL